MNTLLSWRSVGWLPVAVLALAPGAAVRADGVPPTITIVQVSSDGATTTAAATSATAPTAPSKYFLGVVAHRAPDALRAQLDLPKDQGVLVELVMIGGPAAKAGIQPNDVLLMAGDKRLTDVPDLAQAVEAAKEQKLSIKLLRGGKPMTIEATPAERPKQEPDDLLKKLPPGAERDALEQWLRQFGPGQADQNGHIMRLLRPEPGMVLPPGVGLRSELPDDMSVIISREGKKPAQITVKRGSDQWEVSDKELAKLPDDVRRQVEPLLWGGPLRIELHDLAPGQLGIASPPDDPGGPTVQNPLSPDFEDRVERRLDEMNRRLDEMREAIKDPGPPRSPQDTSGPERKAESDGKGETQRGGNSP